MLINNMHMRVRSWLSCMSACSCTSCVKPVIVVIGVVAVFVVVDATAADLENTSLKLMGLSVGDSAAAVVVVVVAFLLEMEGA